ncbi:MAG: glycosyltransferase, partial [Planktothrix sp.]
MNELRYNEDLLSFVRLQWQQWQPAFIYQRYSLGNYTGVQLKDLFGVPYVCEYNGSFAWMTQNWVGKRLFHEGLINKIELLNLQGADLVVVVSKVMLNELTARGIAAEKILVNPNGVDPEQYSPTIDGSPIR